MLKEFQAPEAAVEDHHTKHDTGISQLTSPHLGLLMRERSQRLGRRVNMQLISIAGPPPQSLNEVIRDSVTSSHCRCPYAKAVALKIPLKSQLQIIFVSASL